MRISNEKINAVAEVLHNKWWDWSKNTHDRMKRQGVPQELLDHFFEHWSTNWRSFDDLSEELKKVDRIHAKQLLKIIGTK